MIKAVSTFLTGYLRKKDPSLSLTDVLKIDYAIQLILGDLAKFTVISMIFLCFNQLPVFLFSYIMIFSTRQLAGGIHCKTFWSCLIASIIYYLAILLFGISFPRMDTYFYIIFFIISYIIIWKYAPCANVRKPKSTLKNKKKMKVLSLISFIFWTIIFFKLSNIKLCNCILAITLLQIIQLIILTMKGVDSNEKKHKYTFNHATSNI